MATLWRVMETEGAGGASQREFDRASRWAAICEWSDDAIIGWTLSGIVTSWNSGAERMYGYTADEIAGRNVPALIAPDGGGEFAPVRDRLVRGEHVELYDTKARHKGGACQREGAL
jgi:two-component system, chemotaxis family, CheB/CheR fusion protein